MPAAPLRALGYTSAGGCFASIGRNGLLADSECGRQSGPTTIIYWEELNKRTDDLAWSSIWHSHSWSEVAGEMTDVRLLWSTLIVGLGSKQVVAGQTHWPQWDQSAKKESLWARWWRSDTHQAWDDSRLMGLLQQSGISLLTTMLHSMRMLLGPRNRPRYTVCRCLQTQI